MSKQEELFTGTLKSREELKALNYVDSYIDKVIEKAVDGQIRNMFMHGTLFCMSTTDGLSTYILGLRADMFSKIVKQEDVKEVYAKGKVKRQDVLMKLGLNPITIHRIISLMDSKGFLEFKDTAKSDIVVIGNGWTVPYSIFEYTEHGLRNPTGLAGDISESFDKVLDDTPGLTIPENTLEATEHLNSYCEPFKMSNNLFNKISKFRNRTHYVKLQLDNPDLSFRYPYVFEDRPHLEGVWIIKSHSHKQEIIVTEDFVRLHFRNIIGVTEVVGKRVVKTNGYTKVITNWVTKEIENIVEK